MTAYNGLTKEKMIKTFFIWVVLLALLGCADNTPTTGVRLVSRFEGGERYEAGEVTVLSLYGSHHQMGRQYGGLMKEDMLLLYQLSIDEQYIGSMNMTYDRLKQIADILYNSYPQKFRNVVDGMAETSGLGSEKQKILNAIEMFPSYNSPVIIPPLCSGIAVWGDYTAGGLLIFGRNNDAADYNRKFAAYTTVSVYHPTDSGQPTAIVNYAGLIYAPSGMNQDGIFLELNSGAVKWIYPDRPFLPSILFSFLEDYSTLSEYSPAFKTIKGNATLPSIVNITDDMEAFSYEISAVPPEPYAYLDDIKIDDVKQRGQDLPGLLVATNHFVDPSWGISPDDADGKTLTRRNNLIKLPNRYKGSFDVETMKKVLDTPIEDGGATMSEGTIYQIIVVPKERLMWLQAPENFKWQKIDLNLFF